MSSTEVEHVKGDVVGHASVLDELTAYINGLEPEDPAEVQERILSNILNATSAAELVNAGGAVPSTELLNIPLRVHAIHPGESTFTSGPGWYLHVEVETVANGDRLTMSVGAQDVIAKLAVAAMRGWLPFDFKLERSAKPTADGYYPIFMRGIQPPTNGARPAVTEGEKVTTAGGDDPF